MAISSFFHGPSCAHIFFFLFFSQYLDLHVSIFFFSIAHASLFLKKTGERERERPTQIVEHLFCGMSGWYNANFSKKHNKRVYGVHVNLDHESMKRILSRVTRIWQSSMRKTSSICVYGFQEVSSCGFGRTFGISKRSFAKGFPKDQVKIILFKPYLKHQLLRWVCFPKDFCSQASRWWAWNKTYASQP